MNCVCAVLKNKFPFTPVLSEAEIGKHMPNDTESLISMDD